MKKQFVFWVVFVILVAYVFGNENGIMPVLEPGLLRARVHHVFSYIGMFAIGIVVYSQITDKKQNDYVVGIAICALLIAVNLGWWVDCDDVYKFCRNASSNSEYAVCYDKQGAYGC